MFYNKPMKKKNLNTNWEIYNFLNITNRKLSKQYKYFGRDFLPDDFDVNEKTIKERILLGEMSNTNIVPSFVYEDKKKVKKHFKNSLKNCKKMLQNRFFSFFTPDFLQKMEIYMDMRMFLTRRILQDFRSQSFDEVAAYQEIFNLNPVLGEMLDGLYANDVDIQTLLLDFEHKYKANFLAKVKEIEQRKKKQKEQNEKFAVQEAQKTNTQTKINKKDAKIVEKTVKKEQKLQNTKEIQTLKQQNNKANIRNK